MRKRLRPETPLEVVPMGPAGTAAPIAGGAAEAYTIGRPRRSEHPLYVPSLRAVVFGDAVVGAEGGLRFWNLSSGTGADWYRDVFAPTLRAAGRAAARARPRHARAAGDRRRAAAAGGVSRRASGARPVLTPAAGPPTARRSGDSRAESARGWSDAGASGAARQSVGCFSSRRLRHSTRARLMRNQATLAIAAKSTTR